MKNVFSFIDTNEKASGQKVDKKEKWHLCKPEIFVIRLFGIQEAFGYG